MDWLTGTKQWSTSWVSRHSFRIRIRIRQNVMDWLTGTKQWRTSRVSRHPFRIRIQIRENDQHIDTCTKWSKILQMSIWMTFFAAILSKLHWNLLTMIPWIMNNCWSGSTLAQVMACCLTAPSHYLTQCWLIISESSDHQLRTISQEIPQPSITKMRLKITYITFHANLPGANEINTLHTIMNGHVRQITCVRPD